jgi:hypothetical protein
MSASPILTFAARSFNSAAGRIRATGRAFDTLCVFNMLLSKLSGTPDFLTGIRLLNYIRECLEPDALLRPKIDDARNALIDDQSDDRRDAMMGLQMLADALRQATLAESDFGFPEADALVIQMAGPLGPLGVSDADLQRAFDIYYSQFPLPVR